MPEFTVPPPAEPGDRVAVVAPSGGHAAEFPHVLELGLERLRERFGLDPVVYPTATKDDEYLAANPEARARDVMEAFRDPEIGAVFTTIGGIDQVRILKHLDPSVLAEHPTRFFGISDNANLALYLWNQGVVSYYGGTVMTTLAQPGAMTDYSERYLRRALFEQSVGEVEPAPAFTDEDLDWANPENLTERAEFEPNPGWQWAGAERRVEGRLWGGCLTVLETILAANRFAPPTAALEGTILLLETSELLPSAEQVRTMLLALGERGVLAAVDGVVVGRAKARSPTVERTGEEREAYRARQRETVLDVVHDYNPELPVVTDVDVGHTEPEVPMPIGGRVVLEPAAGRVAFP